jgi:hypothetical protein
MVNQMKLKSIPILEILATAVAAYEHNNKSIIRNPVTIEGIGYVSNRQLISESVQGLGAPFVVNDFHRKQAEGIVIYLEQTVIMQSLRGTPDRFLSQVTEIINRKDGNIKEFGIIAWAPHLVDQYQQKEHVREVGARYERTSRYTGRIGETITATFTLIEKRYVQSTDCWAVYGVTEHDNLVFYWAKNLDKVCEAGRIQGRVKSHREESYRNNAKVTVLNYVKVL